MREIKFRGKRIDNGEWVYGSLVRNYKSYSICQVSDEQAGARRFYKVIPETVGQMVTINDNDFYEGDLFDSFSTYELKFGAYTSESHTSGHGESDFEVIMGFYLHSITNGRKLPIANSWGYKAIKEHYIGNKFDDPELLKS